MVVNLLTSATNELGGAFSQERIEYALQMTGLGLGAVFAVLAIIWLVLIVFKFFLYDLKNKPRSEEKVAETNVASEPVVEQVPPTVPVTVASDDATVAAIMAAISAYISEDPNLSQEYSGGFRVVSFKRVRPKATWNTKNN